MVLEDRMVIKQNDLRDVSILSSIFNVLLANKCIQ